MKQDIQYCFGCLYHRNPRHEMKRVFMQKTRKFRPSGSVCHMDLWALFLARAQLFKAQAQKTSAGMASTSGMVKARHAANYIVVFVVIGDDARINSAAQMNSSSRSGIQSEVVMENLLRLWCTEA